MKMRITLILFLTIVALNYGHAVFGQEVANPTAAAESQDPAAKLRRIIKDLEDNPVETADRDEVFGRARELFDRMRKSRSASGSGKSEMLTDVQESQQKSSTLAPSDRADNPDATVAAPPQPPQLVASTPSVKTSAVSSGGQAVADPVIVSPENSTASLENRVRLLETQLDTVNRKLKWLSERFRKLASDGE